MPQRLEIEDFSGGVTDYYLNAPPNKQRYCDNMLLVQYPESGKPFTRPGSELYSSTAPQIPAGAQRISTAMIYKELLHLQSSQKLYWYEAAAWSTANGPTGNNAFPGASTASVFTYGNWNYHTLWAYSDYAYPMKSYINTSNDVVLLSAGLPKPAAPTLTYAAGTENWLYVIVYKYTYTTKDGAVFIDRSTPSDIVAATLAASPVTVNLPAAYSNGATDNFDTANLKIEIYRTLHNGSIFYFVAEVADGTASYVDGNADTVIELNALLYTTGGVLDNDRPPKCKLVHIFNDTAYYGNLKLGTEILNFRIQQSIPGDIDSAPASLFIDLDGEIVGLSSTKSNLIALTREGYVYRIDGQYDELGRGVMTADRISDTATCISAQSCVQALDGLFWAGYDGIYYTDGFRVLKLNGDFDKTWNTYVASAGVPSTTKQLRIQGKYDKRKNRIWWTIQETSVDDVDKCYILDLNFGVRENATFTTCSGLSSFSPTAIEFDNGDLVRCDRRGYVFKHKTTLFSDPKVNVAIAATLWSKQTIFYTLESIAFNFGTSFMRKWVTGMNLVADSVTNLSLQIVSNNDDDRMIANLLPLRYRGSVVWGDEDVIWGDPTIVWGMDGIIAEKRHMPAKSLRCSYKAVKFTNAYVVIVTSDLLGTIDIDATAKTATLTNAASFDWPSQAVDWFISFEADNYTREYLITARTNDVLTYSDGANQSVTATASKWVIRGYPKDEILNLINYSLHYDIIGKTQDVFNTADTGEISS